MPLYEFSCDKCGRFEVSRRFEEVNDVRCPSCKGKVRRVFSPFSYSFGWRLNEQSFEVGNPMELEIRI